MPRLQTMHVMSTLVLQVLFKGKMDLRGALSLRRDRPFNQARKLYLEPTVAIAVGSIDVPKLRRRRKIQVIR